MMELNREQVVKALEWCSSGGRNCMKCSEDERNPRLSKEGCMALQIRNALALVRELTEENERLNIDLEAMRGAANSYKMHYEAAKADTVRKMQERLAKLRVVGSYGVHCYLKDDIDQIAKEMLEDQE